MSQLANEDNEIFSLILDAGHIYLYPYKGEVNTIKVIANRGVLVSFEGHLSPHLLRSLKLQLKAMYDIKSLKPEPIEDTETLVCKDIKSRQELGIKKYNSTVANNPLELKQWLQHAYEETLDQAVYLKRAIQELERK